MKPTQLSQMQARNLHGISVRTNNAAELQGQGKIAALWGQFMQTHPSAASVLAVYHNYQSDAQGDYDLTLVNEAQADAGTCQAQIREGQYLRFDSEATEPAAVLALWQTIWQYFAQSNASVRAYLSDFEHYHGSGVSIYIGVK